MTLYAIIAAIAAVVLGVAVATLKMLQGSAEKAGAASEAKAATEAANAGLEAQFEREARQAQIIAQEPSKDETISDLRTGKF